MTHSCVSNAKLFERNAVGHFELVPQIHKVFEEIYAGRFTASYQLILIKSALQNATPKIQNTPLDAHSRYAGSLH